MAQSKIIETKGEVIKSGSTATGEQLRRGCGSTSTAHSACSSKLGIVQAG